MISSNLGAKKWKISLKHDFEAKNCIFAPKKATLVVLGQKLGHGATKWAGALNLEWSKVALGYEQDMIALVWVPPIEKNAFPK